jgi:hypothetical protein
MEIVKKIKDNPVFYSLILVLILLFYYIINLFAYFDLPNLCYIGLDKDILSGNKETMRQAISLLKRKNREDYKNLCRYVDTISEKYCFAFDPRVENEGQDPWRPGCYVKGSKTIYLKPEKEKSDTIIKQRAEDIKKFMLMSKAYWENK